MTVRRSWIQGHAITAHTSYGTDDEQHLHGSKGEVIQDGIFVVQHPVYVSSPSIIFSCNYSIYIYSYMTDLASVSPVVGINSISSS